MTSDRFRSSRVILDDVISNARKLYTKHEEIKGDSWREMSIDQLIDRFEEEYTEFENKFNDRDYKKAYEEILDVINFGKMIAGQLILLGIKNHTEYRI